MTPLRLEALVWALLVAFVPAQQRPAATADRETPSARTVRIQNLSPHPRDEWFTVSVPFAKGAVKGMPDLHAAGHATVWQPFGATWPDGSVRQALCMFRAQLPAMGQQALELQPGKGPPLELPPLTAVQADFDLRVFVAGAMHRAQPQQVEILEQNAARTVKLLRCRVPEVGIVGEIILEEYAGQEHVGFDVAVFFSDPTTKDMQRNCEKIVLASRGGAVLLRHGGPLAVETELVKTGSRVTLLRNQILGDGQGLRRTGVLVPPLKGDRGPRDQTLFAAAISPALGATVWTGTGAYGPFGFVPPPPPWLRGASLVAAMRGRHARFLKSQRSRSKDPFRNFPFGLAKSAGQTGDQEDFGVVKLESVAGTGIPSFLFEVELSVLQEGCRPVHFFEADGSPVQSAKHPQWVVWSGRTHWHCDMSHDRLGKACPAPEFTSHGWTGKDRQHWSSLYLTAFYLLTGKHWAKREIENEVQLYMAAQTVNPEFITSGPGAPRGAGRVMLSACWLYLSTGDAALLERMHRRIDLYARTWAGRTRGPDQVRTFQVAEPDDRMLGGKVRYWTPWQDAIAAVGFEAFHRMTDSPRAGALARAVALNQLEHGWRTVPGKAPIIATAMRWKDGAPLTAKELGDASYVLWSHGTAFSMWSIGAVEIARQAAAETGREGLARRAEGILKFLRSKRPVPSDRWFDRLGQWDGVR